MTKTTMENYNLKVRLFKCPKLKGIRKFELLSETGFAHETFLNKESVFSNFLNNIKAVIAEPIKTIKWIKGETWHDDMLYIEVDSDSDTYYKVAHFSS